MNQKQIINIFYKKIKIFEIHFLLVKKQFFIFFPN